MTKYADDDKAYWKLPRKLKKKLPKGQAKKGKTNDLKIVREPGPFKMTKPVRIPIYKTVDGKKKLVGYREYDADLS